MSKAMIGLILVAAGIQIISAIDTVVWNFPAISTQLDFKNLVSEASPSAPLLVALTEKFSLAEFSKLANVYAGNENSKIPGIFKSIAGSTNYGAEWCEDNFLGILADRDYKGVAKYASPDDDAAVETASIVLIQGEDLPSIDASVAHVVGLMKGKSYKAVLSGKEEASPHKIEKRQAKPQPAEPVSDDSIDDAAEISPFYVATPNCTAWIQGANIQYYVEPNFAMANMTTQSVDCKVTGGQAVFTVKLQGTAGAATAKLQVERYKDLSWTVSFINITASNIPGYTKPPYIVNTMKWLNQIYSVASFSYACGQTPFYWSGTPTAGTNKEKQTAIGIQFLMMQIQPFYPQGNFTSNVDDCVPFFSAGAWMSLLTIFLLLLILLFGLVMITSLKTMDRFDDPKGRSLQINVRE